MSEMEIVPYERFGPVRFGATEDEITEMMGRPDRVWPKDSGERQMLYDDLQVLLDTAGRCKLVEADQRVCVPIVDGDLRLEGSLDDLVRTLHERGFETRQGPDPGQSYETYCDALGIVLWRESQNQEHIDTVAALRRDSYREETGKQKHV